MAWTRLRAVKYVSRDGNTCVCVWVFSRLNYDIDTFVCRRGISLLIFILLRCDAIHHPSLFYIHSLSHIFHYIISYTYECVHFRFLLVVYASMDFFFALKHSLILSFSLYLGDAFSIQWKVRLRPLSFLSLSPPVFEHSMCVLHARFVYDAMNSNDNNNKARKKRDRERKKRNTTEITGGKR